MTNRVYIGAENIVSPLGFTAQQNFNACINNQTGIAAHSGLSLNGQPVFVSCIINLPATAGPASSRILHMLYTSVQQALSQTTLQLNSRTILIVSTTKGDIEALEHGNAASAELPALAAALGALVGHSGSSTVVSNACISGSAALILAHDLIAAGRYDNAIVTGADVVSRFTVTGFQSLHALSPEPARPFCKTRKGVSLGEGAATLIVSNNKSIYTGQPMQFSGGATSNDANHISGPSRTGEGLYRAMQRAMALAHIGPANIDFISAHGTGTLFNDDMESIAFNRAGLQHIPLNSFKGYFGHTLGAAGVIETAMCLQSMRHNTLLKNAGMVQPGTVEQVNVLQQHVNSAANIILKTASGFGGCNAALLIKRDT